MASEEVSEYIVECFWPGVALEDLGALDERANRIVAELAREGEAVHYLGSLLMREDEVVFCSFQGPAEIVRDAATRAEIPFERILEAARSPWSSKSAVDEVCGADGVWRLHP